jgi:broad specificity phosphatase PhoE
MRELTIYYIRHGETSWNAEGRLQGVRDIPLNDLGRSQATQAGGILAELLARDGRDKSSIPFVASPLGRARATMELVRGALQLQPDDYAIDDRLREIGYGEWEGSTLAEMQIADPAFYAHRLTDKWSLAPEGGETYASVQLRMRDWYDGLRVDTVAVAHGGTARALMVLLGIETPESAAELYIEQGVVYVFKGAELTKYRQARSCI